MPEDPTESGPRVAFSGPGATALKSSPELAAKLARMLVYGSRSEKRRAEAYLKKHHIRAESGVKPLPT